MSAMLQSGWSTEDDLIVKEKLYTYFKENEYWFKGARGRIIDRRRETGWSFSKPASLEGFVQIANIGR